MKRKLVFSFWVPTEVTAFLGNEFELAFPDEKAAYFSMDELRAQVVDADAIMVGGELMDKAFIDLGKNLKAIGRLGVGCDAVDCAYAGQKGIAVINSPHTVTHPTAELAVAAMMDVARCVTSLDKRFRQEKRCWALPTYDKSATSLHGKTVGIIGFGRIGKAFGEKARGLGMNILYSDLFRAPKEVEDALQAKQVATEELLKTADFVTIHAQYTPENHHLINAGTLALMKPSAYLVNASRGKMVDEAALVAALKAGKLKGAALDVFEFEPEVREELLDLDNVVLTPHVGTWSYDARVAMAIETLTGIRELLNGGTPSNIFNRELLKGKWSADAVTALSPNQSTCPTLPHHGGTGRDVTSPRIRK